jgi:hypothetical protein
MKKLICSLLLILGAICVLLLSRESSSHPPIRDFDSIAKYMPGPITRLKLGMTQEQVLALVGPPEDRSVFRKFEHKTPAQWAQIESQREQALAVSADSHGNPGPQAMIDALELTHRFHDVWLYRPYQSILLTLYFGEDKILRNVEYLPAPTINATVSPPTDRDPPEGLKLREYWLERI